MPSKGGMSRDAFMLVSLDHPSNVRIIVTNFATFQSCLGKADKEQQYHRYIKHNSK